jgi:hypothetical protein
MAERRGPGKPGFAAEALVNWIYSSLPAALLLCCIVGCASVATQCDRGPETDFAAEGRVPVAPDLQPAADCAPKPAAEPSFPAATPKPGEMERKPPVLATLEALGGKSGVPDGMGAFWYPGQSVHNEPTKLGFFQSQVGATAPLWSSATDTVYGNLTISNLAMSGSATLPKDGRPFPGQLWDIEVGGAYVKELDGGVSCGLLLAGGSASDQIFADFGDMTLTGSAFVRFPQSDTNAWLLYLVYSTNAQIGRRIPIPGVGYECEVGNFKGLIGFPFMDLKYQFTDDLKLELYYGALTDVQLRLSYQLFKGLTFYQEFAWINQAWRLDDRPDPRLTFFRYEKHLDVGLNWLLAPHLSLDISGGFAFDRYFAETYGIALHSGNEVKLASTPYVGAQLLFQY